MPQLEERRPDSRRFTFGVFAAGVLATVGLVALGTVPYNDPNLPPVPASWTPSQTPSPTPSPSPPPTLSEASTKGANR